MEWRIDGFPKTPERLHIPLRWPSPIVLFTLNQTSPAIGVEDHWGHSATSQSQAPIFVTNIFDPKASLASLSNCFDHLQYKFLGVQFVSVKAIQRGDLFDCHNMTFVRGPSSATCSPIWISTATNKHQQKQATENRAQPATATRNPPARLPVARATKRRATTRDFMKRQLKVRLNVHWSQKNKALIDGSLNTQGIYRDHKKKWCTLGKPEWSPGMCRIWGPQNRSLCSATLCSNCSVIWKLESCLVCACWYHFCNYSCGSRTTMSCAFNRKTNSWWLGRDVNYRQLPKCLPARSFAA